MFTIAISSSTVTVLLPSQSPTQGGGAATSVDVGVAGTNVGPDVAVDEAAGDGDAVRISIGVALGDAVDVRVGACVAVGADVRDSVAFTVAEALGTGEAV